MNGRLRAYSAQDGKVVWEFDTGGRTYQTVNGPSAAPGGNLDGPGPVIADGMLYVVSGYQGSLDIMTGAAPPPSVLLALSIDGR
jgi:polyvinyl alcohol dehydrogenase (cytochrome)